jgi:hypothetical protein
MRHHIRATVLTIASASALLSSRGVQAQQPAQTDARWYAWLGCWAPDTSGPATRAVSQSITCIVPVANSRAVDALTILRGKVTTRDRLDAGGRPHAIDGQGCRGTEVVNWSAAGRRVFLHADYTCAGGTPGASATIFALTPEGEWLRIERVRSGGGAVVSTDRLHEVDVPALLSPDVARSLESQRRAITTARAAAAVAITTDEIIEAVRALDGDVVRSWLVASDQQFSVDAQQIAMLTNAGVPPTVLQLIAAATTQYQDALVVLSRNTVAYPNDPGYAEPAYPEMTTMRRCPPDGCYPANQYSVYNGYPYGPQVAYPYASSPYYYPAPIVVVSQGVNRGVNRFGTKGVIHGGVNRGGNRGVNQGGFRQPMRPPARPTQPRTAVPVGRRR